VSFVYRVFCCYKIPIPLKNPIVNRDFMAAEVQHAGTSVQMIEDNYCGELQLDPTIFQLAFANRSKSLASPTGFELQMEKITDEAEEPDVIDISKLKMVDE
jgi:hypothetical protein